MSREKILTPTEMYDFSLGKEEEKFAQQVNRNTYVAKVFRLLANYFEDCSDAEIATRVLHSHNGNEASSLAWLDEARADINLSLHTLLLLVRLEALERATLKGGK